MEPGTGGGGGPEGGGPGRPPHRPRTPPQVTCQGGRGGGTRTGPGGPDRGGPRTGVIPWSTGRRSKGKGRGVKGGQRGEVSPVQPAGGRPVAILTADWHTWPQAPAARRPDPELGWLRGVVGDYLANLTHLQKELGGVPIFVAGDLTHHWNGTPELINFLLAYM